VLAHFLLRGGITALIGERDFQKISLNLMCVSSFRASTSVLTCGKLRRGVNLGAEDARTVPAQLRCRFFFHGDKEGAIDLAGIPRHDNLNLARRRTDLQAEKDEAADGPI
jgi:hypothetical protein